MAACSDVRKGNGSDMEQNVMATYNVLRSMQLNNVKKIVFPSSQAVYGITKESVKEGHGPMIPESLYAASKISCEAYISAFCKLFGMRSWIFRLANIVGRNQTHGVILDFVKKLKENPRELEILGDGKQRKSYMLVDDTIDGIMFALKKSNEPVNIFNLGNKNSITVSEIAKIVTDEMKLVNVKLKYTGGSRGWPGDVPSTTLSIDKISALGWEPKYKSADAIRAAARSLL
jgi:UDP-glucose 4-epimerase